MTDSAPRRVAISNELLDAMQLRADPLADATVSALLGASTDTASAPLAAPVLHWRALREANRLMSQWTTNGSLATWQPTAADGSVDTSDVAQALVAYVHAGRVLPSWANQDQISAAEKVFMDHGVLSCLLLFCASLPECYVLPDLSDVLHAAGQLEAHTDHRIRSTAAMIFPIMMRGGLTSPEGGGVPQVLKVRLIHAMIRHLILRGPVENAVAQALELEPLVAATESSNGNAAPDMFQALFAHGWSVARDGLPCNQEELAYTLLTFHYIFVRGMRTLAIPLSSSDELAYIHAWNVMGHVLGIETNLMPQTFDEASRSFELMQARGRADAEKRPGSADPRPKLGRALVENLERVIPVAMLKGVPSLLTKTLCGQRVVEELGVSARASFACRLVYTIGMGVVRVIDGVVRLVIRDFSLSRMLSRVVGYHLLTKFLMDQTRPLRLPDALLNQVDQTVATWSEDAKAPAWINRIEDRFTMRGAWADRRRKQAK